MAAAVGALVSTVFTSAISSTGGALLSSLVESFGVDNVVKAFVNMAADIVEKGLHSLLDSLPMPDWMRDGAKQVVSDVTESFRECVDPELQDAVNQGWGSEAEDAIDNQLSIMERSMLDETKEATSRRGERGSSAGKGGDHFLLELAKIMGEASGKHLGEMYRLGIEMGNYGTIDESTSAAFASDQAMFQAEAQIFKMYQEAISTMMKAIGEGMSRVAARN